MVQPSISNSHLGLGRSSERTAWRKLKPSSQFACVFEEQSGAAFLPPLLYKHAFKRTCDQGRLAGSYYHSPTFRLWLALHFVGSRLLASRVVPSCERASERWEKHGCEKAARGECALTLRSQQYPISHSFSRRYEACMFLSLSYAKRAVQPSVPTARFLIKLFFLFV